MQEKITLLSILFLLFFFIAPRPPNFNVASPLIWPLQKGVFIFRHLRLAIEKATLKLGERGAQTHVTKQNEKECYFLLHRNGFRQVRLLRTIQIKRVNRATPLGLGWGNLSWEGGALTEARIGDWTVALRSSYSTGAGMGQPVLGRWCAR